MSETGCPRSDISCPILDIRDGTYDECHAKIDLFEVEKIGHFSVFKIVLSKFVLSKVMS